MHCAGAVSLPAHPRGKRDKVQTNAQEMICNLAERRII